jgi:hypothetical protein
MFVKDGKKPTILPVEVANIMQQKLECEVCGCRYAVIGAAFFCPSCGHNSVITTFDQTVETVRQIVSQVPMIRSTLVMAFTEDVAQNAIRNTLEDSLMRLVGAFQQFSESLFDELPNAANFKRRKNAFQNISESSTLWRNATGKGYNDFLSPTEMHDLEELFHKRHLIAHRNGIVDQEYIDKSGDRAYTVGQRLVIKEGSVLRLAELLSTLRSELRTFI